MGGNTIVLYQHCLREEPGRIYRSQVAANNQDEVIGYDEVVMISYLNYSRQCLIFLLQKPGLDEARSRLLAAAKYFF